jgi:3-oxoacyl-[acyl-carrier-protein] synthase-3
VSAHSHPVSIVGVGTWLPERVQDNTAWPEAFAQRALSTGDRTFNDIPASRDPVAAAILAHDLALEANDAFLGARLRHRADDSVTAVDAETWAAQVALAQAGIAPDQVDLVLSYGIVPDRITPSGAGAVAHRLGATRALAFGVDAACATAITQLEIAHAYIASGLANVVVLTQSHLMLRTVPLLHPAAPGLGDGATAMVVARGPGLAIRATYGVTHGEYMNAVAWVRGRDDASDPPWWKQGGDLHIGSRVPEQAKLLMQETVSYGAETVRSVVTRAGVDVERIAVLASVQPRGFIPGAIAERLGLPRERAVTTYDVIAHVGASGPVFNLVRAQERGMLVPGAIIALYGQGAGFTRAAALLEVSAKAL